MFDDTIIFFFLLWIVDTSTNIWGGAYQIAIKTCLFLNKIYLELFFWKDEQRVSYNFLHKKWLFFTLLLIPFEDKLAFIFKREIYLLLILNITLIVL